MTEQDKIDAITARLNGHDPDDWFPPWRSSQGLWRVTSIRWHGSYFFKTSKDALRFARTGVIDDRPGQD